MGPLKVQIPNKYNSKRHVPRCRGAQTPSPRLSSADGPLLEQDGQVLAGPQVDWHHTPSSRQSCEAHPRSSWDGGNQTRRPGASPSQSHTHVRSSEGPQALQITHRVSSLRVTSFPHTEIPLCFSVRTEN